MAVIVACLLPSRVILAADAGPVPVSKRGVDRLVPSRGPALLGAVLRKPPGGGVVMAIRRDWLKASDPDRLKRLDGDLAVSTPRAWRRLVERIDAWSATLKPGDPLLALLALERKRVQQRLKAVAAGGGVPATRFVVLEIPSREISSLTIQLPACKWVALVAWVEGLKDVETRSVEELTSELSGKGINPVTASAESLWRNLPVVEDVERTWRVRRALKTIPFSEPLSFQGTGSLLLAVDGKREGEDRDESIDPKVIGELVSQALGGNLGKDLGRLLEQLGGRGRGVQSSAAGTDPLVSAARRAESAGHESFRVTRFQHDITGRRTTVTSEFLVRLGEGEGEWVVVWQGSETIMLLPRVEARKRIERDARIRGVLRLVRGLGVKNGEQAIEMALLFGSATLLGQQKLDARFLRYRDRYAFRLDSPQLWWGRTIRTKGTVPPRPGS
jgi:hypothetical protein